MCGHSSPALGSPQGGQERGPEAPADDPEPSGPWGFVWTSLAPESGGGLVPDLVLAGPLHLQTSWQPWALGPRSS